MPSIFTQTYRIMFVANIYSYNRLKHAFLNMRMTFKISKVLKFDPELNITFKSLVTAIWKTVWNKEFIFFC